VGLVSDWLAFGTTAGRVCSKVRACWCKALKGREMDMLGTERTLRTTLAAALPLVLVGSIIAGPSRGYAKMKDSAQEGYTESPKQNDSPEAPHSSRHSESIKLCDAEAACDRALARLHATLDFQTLFDEMWVIDPKLRESFLKPCFENAFKSTDVAYDPRMAEHVAVSTLNVVYLLCQYEMDDTERPRELQDLLDASEPHSRSPHEPGGISVVEVNRSIHEANCAAEYLRQHLPPDHFSSATYRRLAEQDKSVSKKKGFTKVAHGSASLGIDKDTPVYVICREGFFWDFIEENGQYRLVNFGLALRSLGYL
jgi:hypothetical protein